MPEGASANVNGVKVDDIDVAEFSCSSARDILTNFNCLTWFPGSPDHRHSQARVRSSVHWVN